MAEHRRGWAVGAWIACLLLAGCGGGQDAPGAGAPGTGKGAISPRDKGAASSAGTSKLEPTTGGVSPAQALLEEVGDVVVPTEEEAAAEAAAAIDEQNADAEFERLKAEIEADQGG